ncbi:MAG: hypothetical protein AAF862_07285 [Pseudomonadota bacterium]
MRAEKPRLLIYGTGRHGQETALLAAELGWRIAAACNRAGPKIGQDLGLLAGREKPLGVPIADCDALDFSTIQADLAIVAMTDRLEHNMLAYERLLSAGINVICHGSESYFPQGTNPDAAARIDALAKAGGVTFTGTGVWDHSRIWAGILAAGPCKSITRLVHKSRTLIHIHPYIDLVGIGLSQSDFKAQITDKPGPLGGLYRTIPNIVMHALGFTIAQVTERREPVLYDRPIYCLGLDRDIPPGECAGTRIIAEIESKEGVSARAEIELRLFEEGEVDNMQWHIEGDPHSDVLMTRHDSLRTSSMCMIGRVHDVIAAPPGIQLITQLGPLKAFAGGTAL